VTEREEKERGCSGSGRKVKIKDVYLESKAEFEVVESSGCKSIKQVGIFCNIFAHRDEL
jgi:hypothetical protein